MADKYIVQRRTASGLEMVAELPCLEDGKVDLSWLPVVGTMGSAIIERGSNANGEYVKWADGTMICCSTITLTDINIIETQQIWDTSQYVAPASFNGSYRVIIISAYASNADGVSIYTTTAFRDHNRTYLWNTGVPPADELPGVGVRGSEQYHYTVTSATIRVLAIGRWK